MQPSIFKPMSQEDIEEMVFDNLKQQAQNRNLQLANRDNTIGGTCAVFGIILCLAPGWIYVGIVLFLTGIYFLVAGAIGRFKSRNVTPDAKRLKGGIHNGRNSAKGNCPICDSEIIVYDSVTNDDFQCPDCTGNLHVDNYQVTAR